MARQPGGGEPNVTHFGFYDRSIKISSVTLAAVFCFPFHVAFHQLTGPLDWPSAAANGKQNDKPTYRTHTHSRDMEDGL